MEPPESTKNKSTMNKVTQNESAQDEGNQKEAILNESILTSIKKLLGIDESYTHFDADLIMHINSVFSILTQLGVGPPDGFSINGKDEKWDSFIGKAPNQFSLVKSYMNLKVKLLFDPPLGSAVIESINKQISEFEWRLNAAAESVS